jgi:hypothetical protein
MADRGNNKTAKAIRKMATRYGVAYAPGGNDELAYHTTRLAGDDVQLDPVEQLLIALQRRGHLSRERAVRLQAQYLRELKS